MTPTQRSDGKEKELVAKLEAAVVGSEELDAFIWGAIEKKTITGFYEGSPIIDGVIRYILEETGYTRSVDAAIALVEKALPDYEWTLRKHSDRPYEAILDPFVIARAPSAALALCLAMVKALIARADPATYHPREALGKEGR